MSEGNCGIADISNAQITALRAAEEIASRMESDAYGRLIKDLQNCGCTVEMLEEAMRCIRACARVVVHFHPDRFGFKPATVAESLLKEGLYQNQFETGLSSGGRTAFQGGDRDRWEKDLFKHAYHTPEAVAAERPKYGALDLARHPDGPSPRFGSCYIVLRQAVLRRCTFTFLGTEQPLASERLGTIDRMASVMDALFREVAIGDGTRIPWPPFLAPTLGIEYLTIPRLLDVLCHQLPLPSMDPSMGSPGRVLDSCIEAQVHGSINLRKDVERLVIDPAFEGTSTGSILNEISCKYEIPIQYHCGFQLPVHAVRDDFRGPAMPKLARRIAGDGFVDAAVIGAAEATLHSQPDLWRDWGSREEILQHLKQLWHVVVHYGAPARRSTA